MIDSRNHGAFKALAITPPMTQLNTPYPACAHLVAYLRDSGIEARQCDLSIELALRLFSAEGLQTCFEAVLEAGVPDGYEQMIAQAERYIRVIDPLVRFLQGRESGLATRIVRTDWLPQGPRFAACDMDLESAAFGSQGSSDHARWLATLMIQDLADLFRLSISPHFGLTSYGHALAESAVSFDALAQHLASDPDPIERLLLELLPEQVADDTAMAILRRPHSPAMYRPPCVSRSGCANIAPFVISSSAVALPTPNCASLKSLASSIGWIRCCLTTVKSPCAV